MTTNYEVSFHKKLQNLRQKDLDVRGYIEESHKMTLRSRLSESGSQKLARYLNGLKYSVQGELSFF